MSDPIVTIAYMLLALPFVAVFVSVVYYITKNKLGDFLAAFDWVEQNAERHEFFIFREAIHRRPLRLTAHDREVFELLANRAPKKYAHHIRSVARACDNLPAEIYHA